jgi:hypothetical protein
MGCAVFAAYLENALMLLRMFTPAAMTASLDLRWHLMMVAYEMFILCKFL